VLGHGDHGIVERSEAVRARVDRSAQVRFEAEPESARQRRRALVRVEQDDGALTLAQCHRDSECDFGDSASPRSTHRDDRCAAVGVDRTVPRARQLRRMVEARLGRGVERAEDGHELRHRGVGGDRRVDADVDEVVLPGRLFGVEDAEDAAAASVHRGEETVRERGPTIAHDEHVVLLLQRD
jgi:hypothetical protein